MPPRPDGLTDRMLDVLELALEGLTSQQIADRLFLAVDTVKTHLKRAYAVTTDPDTGKPATAALNCVSIALRRGWLVYDPVTRRITRPPDRTPLPAYAGPDRRHQPPPGPRHPWEPERRRRD